MSLGDQQIFQTVSALLPPAPAYPGFLRRAVPPLEVSVWTWEELHTMSRVIRVCVDDMPAGQMSIEHKLFVRNPRSAYAQQIREFCNSFEWAPSVRDMKRLVCVELMESVNVQ